MTNTAATIWPLAGGRLTRRDEGPPRFLIGLHLGSRRKELNAALLKITGRGLAAEYEFVTATSLQDERFALADEVASASGFPDVNHAAFLAECAAEAIQTLSTNHNPDEGTILACALHGFGQWQQDPLHGYRYRAWCDTSLLSQATGLTVIDDLPGRDLAYGGCGGPLEATGFWMLLGDPGKIAGRQIRAILEFEDRLRLTLLPPRQAVQLSQHLISHEIAPGNSLLEAITGELLDSPIQDPHGKLAVQGCNRPTLLRRWHEELDRNQSTDWTPTGPSTDALIDILRMTTTERAVSVHDTLCTATNLLADRVATHIKEKFPKSQPVGQLILTGTGEDNGLFVRELKRRIGEIEFGTVTSWQIPPRSLTAAATAVLAQFHLDQIPGNSPRLTGTDVPRILGRLTPGNPANWHEVLATMASTLPDKLPLRSAV